MATDTKPRLLAISGSLRKGSFTNAVLRALIDAAGDKAEIALHTLEAVPPYNQDDDAGDGPAGVLALREAVRAADGVIIGTPEYNYGLPGVVKNALDWASRPYGKGSFQDKAVMTLSVSPAFTGGVRALAGLHAALLGMQAHPLARPEIVVGSVGGKMKDGGFDDPETVKHMLAGVDDLLREVALRRGSRNET